MDAESELVEDDVVARDLPADAVVLDVNPVTVGAPSTPRILIAAVVDDAPVDLDIVGRVLGVEAVPRIVDYEVDELEVVGAGHHVDGRRSERAPCAGVAESRRARLHHFEAPVDGVLAVHRECLRATGAARAPVDRCTLPGVGAHHDRVRRRSGQARVERARVRAAAQPNRVTGLHLPVPTAQRRLQVPWAARRPGAIARPIYGHVPTHPCAGRKRRFG